MKAPGERRRGFLRFRLLPAEAERGGVGVALELGLDSVEEGVELGFVDEVLDLLGEAFELVEGGGAGGGLAPCAGARGFRGRRGRRRRRELDVDRGDGLGGGVLFRSHCCLLRYCGPIWTG